MYSLYDNLQPVRFWVCHIISGSDSSSGNQEESKSDALIDFVRMHGFSIYTVLYITYMLHNALCSLFTQLLERLPE